MASQVDHPTSDVQGLTAVFTRLVEGPFGKLVLPAIILQSVLIGGGYASGREIVQFGARFGAAGWIAIVAIFVGFTVMAILTFEFARVFHVYDYKSFVKGLIWKFWPLFDLLFLVMAVLIIAIMASAAGEIMQQTIGIPYLVGIVGIIGIVAVLTYYGARVIEEFKTVGTMLLYVGYLTFGAIVLVAVWPEVTATFAAGDTSYVADASADAVLLSGILYVGYNLAVYPAVFFTLHRQTTRREAILSGVLAGTLMTLPFLLTYLCLMGFYPSEDVMGAPVPWLPMLESAGGTVVIGLYGLVVGWTLVETSVGLIHAIIDRVDEDLKQIDVGRLAGADGLSRVQSGLLGAGILVGATLLARVGIIELIATGYTLMAYFFIALFAVPLLTIGVYRIAKPDWRAEFWNRTQLRSRKHA
ncbi:hypothetical protein ACFQPA_16155 [Halomarina halobia]|uniref:Membrane protein YkvI n=1 Tax=Halomarina halobia TaxID=3033386 RepID=A0ABD6AE51_9EURY|nr:hypothetical protein [Halomarina sp. PSR21]